MKGLIGKKAWLLSMLILLAVVLGGADPGRADAVGVKTHYAKLPAFLETGLNPNLLLLIDNSASMYDVAYDEDGGANSCYDGVDVDGNDSFVSTKSYAGYFNATPDTWYEYDLTDERFEKIAPPTAGACTVSAPASAYDASDLCLILNSADEVMEVRATGRFWNWLTASKFDVEKEILTGGKYHTGRGELVLETRGCLEKRFIKEILVTKQGGTANGYKATFAVRAADRDEKVTDGVYYSSPATDPGFTTKNNTRIEIYKPTETGFDMTDCQAAIDLWEANGGELDTSQMGQLLVKTDNCLDAGAGIAVNYSNSAFNGIIHFCYDYIVDGNVPSIAGRVTAMQSACEKVWLGSGNLPQTPPSAYYNLNSPATLGSSDVCFGQYNMGRTSTDPWGEGYVGACVEPQATSYTTQFRTCNPATYVRAAGDSRFCNDSSVSGFGDSNYVYFCDGSYNASKDSCSPVSKWLKDTELIPDAGGITSVDWTDDNGDSGDDCTEAAMEKFCQNMGEATVVDSTTNDPNGISWGVPAYLLDSALESQLGEPVRVVKGRVYSDLNPDGSLVKPFGLVQEFKYNLRMGAMEFNKGAGSQTECYPEPRLADLSSYRASLFDCLSAKGSAISATTTALDPSQSDGGQIISYIDDADHGYNDYLVKQLNQIEATAWTPTAEAFFNAVGYFTQDNRTTVNRPDGLRINGADDFIWEHDMPASTPVWPAGSPYAAGAEVQFTHNWDTDGDGTTDYTKTKFYFTRNGGTSTAGASGIDEDEGVDWTPYDPVLANCQGNNILLISDGASTADVNSSMIDLATASGDSGDTGIDGECLTTSGAHSQFGSTWLDDLTYYASHSSNTTLYPLDYQTWCGRAKQPIKTYVVSNGALAQNVATPPECSDKTLLTNAALNSDFDPADDSVPKLYESTDPAGLKQNLRTVFDAIGGEVSSGSAASVISHSRSGEGAIYQAIFYPKQVVGANEVAWMGDVHSLWLDADGNIREDCGNDECTGEGDKILNLSQDHVIEFYPDDNGSAKARRLSEPGGTVLENNILLKDLHYLWSGADWLADASSAQRSYDSNAQDRYIFTMLPDGSGNPTPIVPFTTTALNDGGVDGLTAAQYSGYFNEGTDANGVARTSDGIVNYIRGDDQTYRSRSIAWPNSAAGLKTVKLGDIIHSTPTLVGHPAENYDVIYGDPTYQKFRKKYQNRRAVVYAGGNDGGLHAFNAGFYDRQAKQFLLKPADSSLVEYMLGAELWMYVPKNVFPHLRWLTEEDYGEAHNYYVDGKPYIFDAKIFTPDTDIHPNGWGTVLVVGMRYGGGNIGVDTDGVAGADEIMRSSYSILDITNPELPPVVLAEFTDPGLGYTVGSPTAFPMLRCDKNTLAGKNACDTASTPWPMDWYLAFGSGPHSSLAAPAGPQAGMQGLSDQAAALYVLKLGGTGSGTEITGATSALGNIGSGQTAIGTEPTFPNPPALVSNPLFGGSCSDPAFTNETDCAGQPEIWTAAYCSETTYGDEATCIAAPEVWTPGECSNSSYNDEGSCTAAREIWTPGVCSNSSYSDQTSCDSALATWTWDNGDCSNPTYNGDKVGCDAAPAIWNGTDGTCSNPTHNGDKTNCDAAPAIWNGTDGTCSNSAYDHDKTNCDAAPAIWNGTDGTCSNSAYDHDKTNCDAAPAIWSGTDGTCSNPTYDHDKSGCDAAKEVWTWEVGSCSDLTYGTPATCNAASANETWTDMACHNSSVTEAKCSEWDDLGYNTTWAAGVCSLWGLASSSCLYDAPWSETWTPARCSDHPTHTTEATCLAATETWTWSSGTCTNPDYNGVDQAGCDTAPATWTWTAGDCSNPDYNNDKSGCDTAKEVWTWTAGDCSNPDYNNDKSGCDTAKEVWTWTAGDCSNPDYNNNKSGCDTAKEVWTWTAGDCSNPDYNNNKSGCDTAKEVWTWTAGDCSNQAYNNEGDCIINTETWTPEFCSNNSYDNQTECEAAPEVWTPGECSNPNYGIEASCTAAHEVWTEASCSNSGYTDQADCEAAYEIWTPLGNSFYGDFIAVDYDLSFQTESLYFGSVYDADTSNHSSHKGALHRYVINDNPDPTTWDVNMFYDVGSPVTAAPSVATDGSRAWIYFGTGRLFSAKEDKAILATTPPTQFLGLKENYKSDGEMDLSSRNGGALLDVTNTVVMDGGALSGSPIMGVDTFGALNLEMFKLSGGLDLYKGWQIKLANGERVIGQPAILGDIVTFTSYIPSNDPCKPDGVSYLWAPYFRTGTAYYRSVIGKTDDGEILRKYTLGAGLATTPNIHTGAGDGSKAFVQSSTGAIISVEQTNPGVVKSGMRSWRELNGSCNTCN